MAELQQTALALLATYGLSVLVAEYDGAFDGLKKIRQAAKKSFGGLFECSVCLAVWVGFVICLILWLPVLNYLAVIGGAIFLIRISE